MATATGEKERLIAELSALQRSTSAVSSDQLKQIKALEAELRDLQEQIAYNEDRFTRVKEELKAQFLEEARAKQVLMQANAGLTAQFRAEAREKWGLQHAIAQHRIGRLAIGESAVVVITASSHRREAYEANRHIIDRIKHEVPIWKCEYYADGSHQWGNNCNCHATTGDAAKHIYE